MTDYSLDFHKSSWENCRHEFWKRSGWQKGKDKKSEWKQRKQCLGCGIRVVENRTTRTRMDLLRILGPLFRDGVSTYRAWKMTGINEGTVSKLYRYIRLLRNA